MTTENIKLLEEVQGAPEPEAKVMFVGLDLGTNTSFILGGTADSTDYDTSKIVPSVVGYVKDGLVEGILPRRAEVFFGDEAIENKLHLKLVWPLKDGNISDVKATKDFLRHLKKLVESTGEREVRAVIGIPANASNETREIMRTAVASVFDRILLIPEPFLAALGFRDDSRLGQKHYVDPVTNSLFVDIGAGTTDLCLVQGYFPNADDLISIPFAGDAIDDEINEGLEEVYPDIKLTTLQIRSIKEEQSHVGASRRPIDVKVIVSGKGQTIEVADTVNNACNKLLEQIFESVKQLIARASSDSVEDLMQNILITGGGSQIRGVDTELQKMLIAEGYEAPKVRTVGVDYKRFVGIGAIKAARAAQERQWQILFK